MTCQQCNAESGPLPLCGLCVLTLAPPPAGDLYARPAPVEPAAADGPTVLGGTLWPVPRGLRALARGE